MEKVAVLVGGTAAALHAHHRYPLDHGHVIKDLAKRYDQAISALETIVGWRTKRRVKGRLVLGEIQGIDAGLRNVMRSAPLETTTIHLPGCCILRLPTVEEMLRIKAFLLVQRNAVRDYLDLAALSHHSGERPRTRYHEPAVCRICGRGRRHAEQHHRQTLQSGSL